MKTYYEADLKVEMKPESTKAFMNRVTLGFDHKPNGWHELKEELARRYPQVNLVEVLRVWDATAKATALSEYYSSGTFHGD